jgi:hypothetical protein
MTRYFAQVLRLEADGLGEPSVTVQNFRVKVCRARRYRGLQVTSYFALLYIRRLRHEGPGDSVSHLLLQKVSRSRPTGLEGVSDW